ASLAEAGAVTAEAATKARRSEKTIRITNYLSLGLCSRAQPEHRLGSAPVSVKSLADETRCERGGQLEDFPQESRLITLDACMGTALLRPPSLGARINWIFVATN